MTFDQDPAFALSQLRATLDATADGILVVDATGRVVQQNPSALQMTGRDSLLGLTLATLFPDGGERLRAFED